jgi:hypothetical protein
MDLTHLDIGVVILYVYLYKYRFILNVWDDGYCYLGYYNRIIRFYNKSFSTNLV